MLDDLDDLEKGIERIPKQHYTNLQRVPDQPEDARILKLAVLGSPNAGKSTLINRLMGWKVASVSKKVHTTRKNSRAVFTEENRQIIFVDTPGLISSTDMKKHRTGREMVYSPELGAQQADLIAVVVDAADKWTRERLDEKILKVLHLHRNTPSILILNKVDAMKSKFMLIHLTRVLTEGIVGGRKIDAVNSVQKKDKDNFSVHTYNRSLMKNITGGVKVDLDAFLEEKQKEQEGTFLGNTGYKTPVISLNDEGRNVSKTESDESPQMSEMDMNCESDNVGLPPPKKYKSEDHRLYIEYLNKVQKVARKIKDLQGWPLFQQVFMISALTDDGVDDLKEYLLDQTKRGDWMYHSGVLTDENPMELARQIVWEKLLDHLPTSLPYEIHPEIILWEVDTDGTLNVIMDLVVKRESHLRLLIGSDGAHIRQICNEAKQELLNAFRCEMRFKLQAKLDKYSRF